MTSKTIKDISDYQEIKYPYSVTEDDGEYVVSFPDLPGCLTQVENPTEINKLAQEAKEVWLETAYENGDHIPEGPAQDFSGKFMVRIPKSLHRDLTFQAREEGMSLNAFILHLLSERSSLARLEAHMRSSEVNNEKSSQPEQRKTTYQIQDSPFVSAWTTSRPRSDKSGTTSRAKKDRKTTSYTFGP